MEYMLRLASSLQRFAQLLCERGVLAIHHRRIQPFRGHGIALADQSEGLAQIPTAHVQNIVDGQLDHVAPRQHAQIPFGPVHVDEAHVVIAVRRGETPAATARLTREQNPHVVLRRDGIEAVEDALPHLRVNGVGPIHRVSRDHAMGSHIWPLIQCR